MNSVLLIRLGGLGDLLVAYPSIALIRKALIAGRGEVTDRDENEGQTSRINESYQAGCSDEGCQPFLGGESSHTSLGEESSQPGSADEGSPTNNKLNEREKLGAESVHALKLVLACRTEYGILLKEAGIVDEVLDAGSAAASGLFGGPGASSHLAREELIGRPSAAYGLIAGWMQSEKTRLDMERSLLNSGRSRILLIDSEPCSGLLSRFFFDKTAEFLASEGFGPLPTFEECFFLRVPSRWIEEGRKISAMIAAKPESPSANKLAVVHPGSGSASKRWPLANFADIISRLASAGVSGCLVTGEAEEDMIPSLNSLSLPDTWRWVHRPPLCALAGMIASSALYLGNDSGVTHLAAVCGASGAGVFLKDHELRWAPYGCIRVVSEADVKNISIASIWKICCRFLATG